MPKFLEDKLKAEYGNNKHAIYGTMNAIGAMHGNKETAKGREMERKHFAHIRPMAYGGMVVPDDPYAQEDQMNPLAPTRTRQMLPSAAPPPPPYNIPEPPPMPAVPPPLPSYAPQWNQGGYTSTPAMADLAKGGSLGSDIPDEPPPDLGHPAGAMPDMPGAGTPEAAKVDTPAASSHTQMVPAAQSQGDDMAYGAGSDNPGSPATPPEPPEPPTIGKTTGFDLGVPKVTTPMTDKAIKYGEEVLADPKHPGQYKKPAAWQNIVGGILGAYPRLAGIDVHPNLTRQYQNFGMLSKMAEEERKAQVSAATEQSHRASAIASLTRANRDTLKGDKVQQYRDMQEAKKTDLLGRGIKEGSPEWQHVMSGYNEPASLQMANAVSPETINRAAERLLFFQEPPQGGRGGTAFILRVHEAAAKMAQEKGISVSQQEMWGMQKKADLADLTKLQTTRDQMSSFEDTASKNLDIALANSHRNGRTGSPLINEYVQWGQGKLLGDDDIALFANSIETAANEYAKVTTGMTSGVLSDAARAQAKTMLDKSLADGTFTKVVKQMKQEMQNRRDGYDKQISEIRQRTLGRQDETPTPRAGTPPPVNAPPPPGPTLEQRGPAPPPSGPLPKAPGAFPEEAPTPAAAAPAAVAPGVAAPAPPTPGPATPAPIMAKVWRKGVERMYKFPDQKAADAAVAYGKAHPNE